MDKCIANGSLAHTVGNVTALFTEFIKSLFPQNFFRHTHISTRMAYREQKREENTKYEFIKKTKPILIIKPKIDIDSEDIFLYNTLFTTNLFGCQILTDASNMMPFFLDRENGCELTYKMGRIRVLFEVTIMLDTEYEQINQYHFLHTLFCSGRVYQMHTALEYYIPGDLMELVSAYSGVPIIGDTGTTREFLDYMMSHSNKYITFKERPSSGTKDFFMYYPLTVEYTVGDFNRDEPNKKAWAVYSSNISFSIMAEFNIAQLYEFNSSHPRPKDVVVDFGVKTSTDEGINIIPSFTIGNLFDKTKMDNGFELFYSQAFSTDPNTYGEKDVLELKGLFKNTNAFEIIEWHQKMGIPNEVFLQMLVTKDNAMLKEGEDYSVDWDNVSVTVLKSDPDSTYRLNIFINNLYIQRLLENYNSTSGTFDGTLMKYEQDVGKTTNVHNIKPDNNVGMR